MRTLLLLLFAFIVLQLVLLAQTQGYIAQGYAPPALYINGAQVKPKNNRIDIFISPKVAVAFSSEGTITILERAN